MTSRLSLPVKILNTALLVILMLSLSACGFQPRSTKVDLSAVPAPLHISGIARYSDLQRELRIQMGRSGLVVAESAQDSTAILRISNHETDTRLLSLDSSNRAIEYELEESVLMALHDRSGRELLAPQQIRAQRIWFRPPEGILGSGREAELLREDMREEIAQHILRRLATLN